MTTGAQFTFVEETGSTNADMAAALRSYDTPADGAWLIARRQVAGKGRQGREWHGGFGNFMGSTVVSIRDGDPPAASLSFVTALAVAQAIEEVLGGDSQAKLKWPNDVLVDGGKVSGILLEMVSDKVVVGIGVNLASAPDLPDRKTAALKDYGTVPEPEKFAEILAEVFAKHVAAWRSGGLSNVLRGFLLGSIHHTGSPVTVHDSDGSTIAGTFLGLEQSDGALRLTLADGSERVIRAGDIS